MSRLAMLLSALVAAVTPFAATSLMVAPLAAQEKEKTGPPTISWYGQSFFTVKSSKGALLAIDPHLIPAFNRPVGLKPDVVLFSHLHSDHTNVAALDNAQEKSLRILSGLSSTGTRTTWNKINETVKDFHIRSIPCYHDATEGMTRGKNSIFIIEVDGWRICHLGDLGHELTDEQLRKVGAVDVLMVPVGGIYALNGSEAKKVVQQIQPKEYIFPMHYGTKNYDDLLPIDEFLEDVEKARIAVSDDNKITLNRDPQRPRPLIVQLNSSPKVK